MKTEIINCIRCKNYYVTWDKAYPKGCKLFGFKTALAPSVLVQQATGAQCKNFSKKEIDCRITPP